MVASFLLALSLTLQGVPLAQKHAATPAAAEDRKNGITEEQAAKILDELQNIRMLLESRQATDRPVASESSPEVEFKTLPEVSSKILGDSKAPITLVEFLDFQCPFCVRFHRVVVPNLKRKYIDTGLLRLVIMNMPLQSHIYSRPAALFAE